MQKMLKTLFLACKKRNNVLYCCCLHRNAEIEFLRILDGKIVPVEMKSGRRTQSKSLASYCDRYNPGMKIKTSALPYAENKNLANYPLYLASKIL